jgi:uncharacterized protein (TIGR03663 family)
MRIAARTSSGHTGARADFPGLRNKIDDWKTAFAEANWVPWMILAAAAFLRFFLLGIKPPHFDEGINGWFVDQVVKNGFYRYDPTNYHGPLHFYVLLVSEWLFGRNVWALRLPVVLVSIGCVWLTLKFEPLVGRHVSRLAALAMAISPGCVFYGRYSIHEVWLALFSILFILGLLGLWKFGTANYLWCTGTGVAGMILTKETYIIHLSCALLALVVLWFWNEFLEMCERFAQPRSATPGSAVDRWTRTARWFMSFAQPVRDARAVPQRWHIVDLAFVVATGAAVIVFFYSGTFFHWSGVKDLYQAYFAWFATGHQGHGHEKPWYYWVGLLAHYEYAALVGLLLCLFAQRFNTYALRYISVYAVGTLAAYSIVNYKTPWCIISITWPFFLTFGAMLSLAPVRLKNLTYKQFAVGLFVLLLLVIYYWKRKNFDQIWPFAFIGGMSVLLVALTNVRWTAALMGALLGGSLISAISVNYFRCTTETEPYVYVQTYNDIFKFTKPLFALVRRTPLAYQLTGHIIRTSSYPLPWILGDFAHVGYYEKDNLPEKIDAAFLLVQEDRITEVESKLHETYYTDTIRIRAYQESSKIYFNAKYFKDVFPGREPDFVGK